MSVETNPTLRKVILEPVYLSPPDMIEGDSQPLLDETGNFIRDEQGLIIYGET